MKPKKTGKKLLLNKETITHLSAIDLNDAKGGGTGSATCKSCGCTVIVTLIWPETVCGIVCPETGN